MTKEIALSSGYTAEQVALIKRTVAVGATDDELAMFLAVCQARGLDPLAREIYFRKYKLRTGEARVTFVTGIDGFRKMAADTGEYDGQTPQLWCGSDGKWTEVWLSNDFPAAARVGVYRKGQAEPTFAVATWKEYFPSNENEQHMWKKMPSNQLAKCAEALALRKAFPRKLSGLTTEDEMQQAVKADPPPPRRYIEAERADRDAFRGAMDLDTIPDIPDPTEEPDIPIDQLLSDGQLKLIHILKGQLGLPDHNYREKLWGRYKVRSSKDLTHDQATAFIEQLEGDLAKQTRKAASKVEELNHDLGVMLGTLANAAQIEDLRRFAIQKWGPVAKDEGPRYLRERFGVTTVMELTEEQAAQALSELAVQ